MSAGTEMNDVQKRLATLEGYLKIAFGVAAVFGLTGAVIFKELANAQSQIAELETKINTLKPIVDASIIQIQDAATAAVHRLATITDASFGPGTTRSYSNDRVGSGGSVAETLRPLSTGQGKNVSLLDVVAAQNRAKEMQKLAERRDCRSVRSYDWHRAQTVYETADKSKEAGQYRSALDEFVEAGRSYEICANGSVR